MASGDMASGVDPSGYGGDGQDCDTGDGRLRRLHVLERSVRLARQALGAAELSMRSVHAGLAPESRPESRPEIQSEPGGTVAGTPPDPSTPAAAPVTPPAASALRLFDPVAHYRYIGFARVPPVAIALALLLGGSMLAVGLRTAFGPERVNVAAAAVASYFSRSRPPPDAVPQQAASLPQPALPAAKPLPEEPAAAQADAGAVIIYERTSPYPGHVASISTRDRQCLAEAIYYEARGEPVAGQVAVAQVVLNRTLAGSWPKTVCEVTRQGVERGEKCQFSYACMRDALGQPKGGAWDSAQGLAAEILAGGTWLEEMLDATHFHRFDLKPVWRLSLVEIGRFGNHVFYNSPRENRRPLSRLSGR